MHLFDLYRRLIVLACCIYAGVRLVQGLSLLCDFSGKDTPVSRIARNYLLTMLVSVRLRRFRRWFVQIALLAALLAAVIYLHGKVSEIW